MLDAMPAKLFWQWHAFYAQEPFGFEIQNLLFANVARMIAAGAGAKDLRLEKFMLRSRKSVRQSTREIMTVVRSMAAVVVTKDKGNGHTGSS